MIDPNNTFFISDFHFDHTNILEYVRRPFKSVEEMNSVMLQRYNEVIKETSTVYFLGDMAFGRGSRKPKWWLTQLRGHVIYLKGSHDKGIRPTSLDSCHEHLRLETGLGIVYLTHEPRHIPADWNGWAIHGHTHSAQLVDYTRRRICVCVEAINYRPISLRQIREAISAIYKKEVSTMRR